MNIKELVPIKIKKNGEIKELTPILQMLRNDPWCKAQLARNAELRARTLK